MSQKQAIMQRLEQGKSAPQIAFELGVAVPTVYYHKQRLLLDRYKNLLNYLQDQQISEAKALSIILSAEEN